MDQGTIFGRSQTFRTSGGRAANQVFDTSTDHEKHKRINKKGHAMKLDIRLPIGLMFSVLGAVLVVSGLLVDRSVFSVSLGFNVNLWWGLVMLVFGVVMFMLGRSGTATARLTEDSPEGMKIEEIEQHSGLEK